jgi:ATP-dependent protease ClpP protease subunit
MEHASLLSIGSLHTIFANRPLAQQHTLYLSGEIGDPENYTEMYELIRHAGENDVIMLYINSPGGNVTTALQFISVMAESSAQIFASVEGECISAATFIFLAADAYAISEHSLFMCHNYRRALMGKGGEIFDMAVHERKWSEDFLKSVYKDFLSDAEITSILDGKDLWLATPEVVKRLQAKVEKQKANFERAQKESEEETTAQNEKITTPKAKRAAKKLPTEALVELAVEEGIRTHHK